MADNSCEDNFLKILWFASLGAGNLAIRHLKSRYDDLENESKDMIDALAREGRRVDASAHQSLFDAAGQIIGYIKGLADEQSRLNKSLYKTLDQLEQNDARMTAIEATLHELATQLQTVQPEKAMTPKAAKQRTANTRKTASSSTSDLASRENATPGGAEPKSATTSAGSGAEAGETATKGRRRSTRATSEAGNAASSVENGATSAKPMTQRKTAARKPGKRAAEQKQAKDG